MSISPGEQPGPSAPSAPTADVDAICDAFEAGWRSGQQPRIEDFLVGCDPVYRDLLLRELLLAEWDLRRRHGQDPELETYSARFPNSRQAITDLWRVWEEMQAQRVSVQQDRQDRFRHDEPRATAPPSPSTRRQSAH